MGRNVGKTRTGSGAAAGLVVAGADGCRAAAGSNGLLYAGVCRDWNSLTIYSQADGGSVGTAGIVAGGSLN